MFPNEYAVRAHHDDLLHQAQQHQLARQFASTVPLTQRAGQQLLRLGARLTAANVNECVTVQTSGQVVTVCPA